jgi:IS5 family transposase
MDISAARDVAVGISLYLDTTVVERNMHYPTDSSLLNDGARVLTRTMRKIESKARGLKRRIRNRMHSVTKRAITIAHALRHKRPEGEEMRTTMPSWF